MRTWPHIPAPRRAQERGAEAVVVVVEDLQWVDPSSARALLFACRRLIADQALILLTARLQEALRLGEGWGRFLSGDRRASSLSLGGLDVSELSTLCRELGRTGLSERTVGRLFDHTGGNPLLARALLAELPDERLKASDGSFRAPRSIAGLFLPRLASLSRPVRDLVVAASVLGDHSMLADVAAVADLAEPSTALGKAERAGFLTERNTPLGCQVSFTHLLIRQAIYDDLGPERRRQLHLRAATVMGDRQALDHRAAAASGPDPELAADLSAAAAAAAGAGKLLLAARRLQQAAAVTGHGPERDERVLSAFELLVRAADVAAADAARPDIEQLPASARRDVALGQLALLAARPIDAESLLRGAWDIRQAAGKSPAADAAAGEAALGLGTLLGLAGAPGEAAVWLDRALGSGTGCEPWYDAARCIRGFSYALGGDVASALDLFRDLPEPSAMVPTARTDALTYRGIVQLWSGDLHAAVGDLVVAVSRINAGLQVRFPGPPLAFLAEAEFRLGRWDEAHGHAELAVALACDADRDYDLPFVHSIAASVPACRADWTAAVDHVEAAERAARPFGGFAAVVAASARALLGLARDDPDEARRGADLALAVAEVDHYDDPAAFWWRPLQVWSLISTGSLDEAETILTSFTSRAAARAQRAALAQVAWLRGSLTRARGDLEQADLVLRAGRQASSELALPFWRGLLDLEHGRCLARMHRHAAAIDALRAARDSFGALSARPFLDAARSELVALGLRSQPSSDQPALTAQELRVARLVASGLSNREAAAQLYLSPKTVEYHLAHAFIKLGVRSRHQLIARIAAGENPGVPI